MPFTFAGICTFITIYLLCVHHSANGAEQNGATQCKYSVNDIICFIIPSSVSIQLERILIFIIEILFFFIEKFNFLIFMFMLWSRMLTVVLE